jgi:hypothetical protein
MITFDKKDVMTILKDNGNIPYKIELILGDELDPKFFGPRFIIGWIEVSTLNYNEKDHKPILILNYFDSKLNKIVHFSCITLDEITLIENTKQFLILTNHVGVANVYKLTPLFTWKTLLSEWKVLNHG